MDDLIYEHLKYYQIKMSKIKVQKFVENSWAWTQALYNIVLTYCTNNLKLQSLLMFEQKTALKEINPRSE